MAAYAFETITPAEALAYNGATDDLQFNTPGAFASMARVRYVAGQNGASDTVDITLNGRTVTFGVGVHSDQNLLFPDGTKLFAGGVGADSVNGTAGADALFGGQGADTLFGGETADLLQGNQGADFIAAGGGDDFAFGGQGDDEMNLGEGANFAQGNLGNDTIVAETTSGRNTLLGGQGDDAIVGGNAGDALVGNLGADTLTGGTGADTLSGEAGADILNGAAGADVFLLTAGSSTVTPTGVDRINNWSTEDRFDIPVAGSGAAFYVIPAAGGGVYGGGGGGILTFETALARSDSWMRDHPAVNVVTGQVAEGVAVFIDTNGDHASDLGVILVGANLFAVSGTNFI